tara:strand:- start:693 stop:1346 length:654 start_codon:yes stop_codon:yes gene_type:complete
MSNSKTKSVFETLSAINVNDKVEKKNNLTYLSWAWAWGEVKKCYPDAVYEVQCGDSDLPYVYDESLGYMCRTTVTINGETLGMWLPVMDGANKSMKAEAYEFETRYGTKKVAGATMFDINKTLMRCLVKNLAMFGLGHYIYAGEDLPETESETPKVTVAPKKEVTTIKLSKGDANWDKVLKYVVANKSAGTDKLINNLKTKYGITATVKKEIEKAIA